MSADQLTIIGIAATWAAVTGAAGLAIAWLVRRRSVLVLAVTVAGIAVASVVAGVVGAARRMFLSYHDFTVVILVSTVAAVFAMLVAGIIGTAMARWSRSMAEEARRFGDSGQFVSPASGPAELQQLSEELTRTSARLRESRERELRLEGSRRELVSWVSHDLRTPLAGLRAMTEALEDGMAEDPARYHRQIRAEVERMVRMVDDLFELSRIHAGVLKLTLQRVALCDIVSEA
ncbi:MAG: histidine kinase dimerization/phospho-acceptor domain-containing protein, partial [Nocardioides sp.]